MFCQSPVKHFECIRLVWKVWFKVDWSMDWLQSVLRLDSFPYRKAIYSSMTKRSWMESPLKSTMENLWLWLLVSVCSTWTQKTNWCQLQYRYIYMKFQCGHWITLFSKWHYHFYKEFYFFITFQLRQQPSEMNPIFLPSDLETDWLLAKIFIKNADALDHEAAHHLLNTHFMGEVYTVATLRCFPVIHPLYKVRPHSRDHSARTCVFLLDLNSCFTGLTGQVVVHERNLFCYGCVFSLLIHTARMCCLLFNSLFVINLSHKRGRIWYGSGKNPFLL